MRQNAHLGRSTTIAGIVALALLVLVAAWLRPSLAALAVFSFIAVWGDFLWPLIITDDPAHYTLPLGVNRLASTFSMDWRLVAAGAVFSILPILAVFSFSQRFFIEGAMKGAVKG